MIKKVRTITAWWTLFCFVISTHIGPPVWAANDVTAQKKFSSETLFPKDLSQIQIPAEMGKIEEVYSVPSTESRVPSEKIKGQSVLPSTRDSLLATRYSSPVVILIQDAHSIPEAQRNIQRIIGHFQETYGVKLVGVEGAYSQLDAQIFKSFPDQELLKKTMEDYFEKGELSGGTAAAIFSEKGRGEVSSPVGLGRGNRAPTVFHGVEDWKLYEEGIALYGAAMKKEPELIGKIEGLEKELEIKKEAVYTKELLEIDKALESFSENQLDLVEVLKKLAKVKRPETVGAGFTRPLLKGEETSPLQMLLAESESDGKDQSTVEMEVKKIAEEVKKYLESLDRRGAIHGAQSGKGVINHAPTDEVNLRHFNQKYQDFQTSRISPQAFALWMKELIKERQDTGTPEHQSKSNKNRDGSDFRRQKMRTVPDFSDRLMKLIHTQKRMRDIQGTKFFEEFEHYADSVKGSLLKNDEQRKLNEESHKLDLMKRFVHLELNREDWKEVTGVRGKGKGIGEESKLDFSFHYAFYSNAESRDLAFFNNLKKLMEKRLKFTPYPVSRNASMLVTGGFHTEGLIQRLKEKNISYVLVMPKINVIPEDWHYKEQMRGEVSWKDYFEVENGKINLYKAFVRAVRDRLLEEGDRSKVLGVRGGEASQYLKPNTRHLLKSWRDQIIRDLSEKGKIEKAGEYTFFMDEVTQKESKYELAKRLERVNQFIEGLKDLEAKGNLTEQNILQLLRPAAQQSPAGTGATIEPAVKSPAILTGDLLRTKIKIDGQPFQILELPSGLLVAQPAAPRAEVPPARSELRTPQSSKLAASKAEVRAMPEESRIQRLMEKGFGREEAKVITDEVANILEVMRPEKAKDEKEIDKISGRVKPLNIRNYLISMVLGMPRVGLDIFRGLLKSKIFLLLMVYWIFFQPGILYLSLVMLFYLTPFFFQTLLIYKMVKGVLSGSVEGAYLPLANAILIPSGGKLDLPHFRHIVAHELAHHFSPVDSARRGLQETYARLVFFREKLDAKDHDLRKVSAPFLINYFNSGETIEDLESILPSVVLSGIASGEITLARAGLNPLEPFSSDAEGVLLGELLYMATGGDLPKAFRAVALVANKKPLDEALREVYRTTYAGIEDEAQWRNMLQLLVQFNSLQVIREEWQLGELIKSSMSDLAAGEDILSRAEVRAVSEADKNQIRNLLDQVKAISAADADKLRREISGIFNQDFSINDAARRKLFGEVTPDKSRKKAPSELQNEGASRLGRQIVGLIDHLPNSIEERSVWDKRQLLQFVLDYGKAPFTEPETEETKQPKSKTEVKIPDVTVDDIRTLFNAGFGLTEFGGNNLGYVLETYTPEIQEDDDYPVRDKKRGLRKVLEAHFGKDKAVWKERTGEIIRFLDTIGAEMTSRLTAAAKYLTNIGLEPQQLSSEVDSIQDHWSGKLETLIYPVPGNLTLFITKVLQDTGVFIRKDYGWGYDSVRHTPGAMDAIPFLKELAMIMDGEAEKGIPAERQILANRVTALREILADLNRQIESAERSRDTGWQYDPMLVEPGAMGRLESLRRTAGEVQTRITEAERSVPRSEVRKEKEIRDSLPIEIRDRALFYPDDWGWGEGTPEWYEKVFSAYDFKWMTPATAQFLLNPSSETYQDLNADEKTTFRQKIMELYQKQQAFIFDRNKRIKEGEVKKVSEGGTIPDEIFRYVSQMQPYEVQLPIGTRAQHIARIAVAIHDGEPAYVERGRVLEPAKPGIEKLYPGSVYMAVGTTAAYPLQWMKSLYPEVKDRTFTIAFSNEKKPVLTKEGIQVYKSYLESLGFDFQKIFGDEDPKKKLVLIDTLVSGDGMRLLIHKILVPIGESLGIPGEKILNKIFLYNLDSAPMDVGFPLGFVRFERKRMSIFGAINRYLDQNTHFDRMVPYYPPSQWTNVPSAELPVLPLIMRAFDFLTIAELPDKNPEKLQENLKNHFRSEARRISGDKGRQKDFSEIKLNISNQPLQYAKIRRAEVRNEIQEKLRSLVSKIEALPAKTVKDENFGRTFEKLQEVSERLTRDYHDQLVAAGLNPGKVRVYLVGGWAQELLSPDQPLKDHNDIDIVFAVENADQGWPSFPGSRNQKDAALGRIIYQAIQDSKIPVGLSFTYTRFLAEAKELHEYHLRKRKFETLDKEPLRDVILFDIQGVNEIIPEEESLLTRNENGEPLLLLASYDPLRSEVRSILNVRPMIISGGQTGADMGGLKGARRAGLKTGGTAPKGYRTERGRNALLRDYGLKESGSAGYSVRTEQNVENSDGTVIFGNVHSSGTASTIQFARKHGKPYLVNPTPSQLREFAVGKNILNIAGNRESKNRGLQKRVEKIIFEAFREDQPDSRAEVRALTSDQERIESLVKTILREIPGNAEELFKKPEKGSPRFNALNEMVNILLEDQTVVQKLPAIVSSLDSDKAGPVLYDISRQYRQIQSERKGMMTNLFVSSPEDVYSYLSVLTKSRKHRPLLVSAIDLYMDVRLKGDAEKEKLELGSFLEGLVQLTADDIEFTNWFLGEGANAISKPNKIPEFIFSDKNRIAHLLELFSHEETPDSARALIFNFFKDKEPFLIQAQQADFLSPDWQLIVKAHLAGLNTRDGKITLEDIEDLKTEVNELGKSNQTFEQWQEETGIPAVLGIKSISLALAVTLQPVLVEPMRSFHLNPEKAFQSTKNMIDRYAGVVEEEGPPNASHDFAVNPAMLSQRTIRQVTLTLGHEYGHNVIHKHSGFSREQMRYQYYSLFATIDEVLADLTSSATAQAFWDDYSALIDEDASLHEITGQFHPLEPHYLGRRVLNRFRELHRNEPVDWVALALAAFLRVGESAEDIAKLEKVRFGEFFTKGEKLLVGQALTDFLNQRFDETDIQVRETFILNLLENVLRESRAEIRSEPSISQAQGKRDMQQDRFLNLTIDIPGIKHGQGKLMAVMDGHGSEAGHFVAALAAWRIPDLFEATLKEKKGDVAEALKILFSDFHDETRDQTSGTTLSLVYIPDDEPVAYAANLGDSPILIYDADRMIYQSPLHNAMNPKEREEAQAQRGAKFYDKEIKNDQGKPIGKVAYMKGGIGGLQLTRSFGDTGFDAYLDRTPAIATVPLRLPQRGPVFVLLGSDGIFQNLEDHSEKIVEFARQNPDAQKMVERAGKDQASDNVTVLLWPYNPLAKATGIRKGTAIAPVTTEAGDKVLNLLVAKAASEMMKGGRKLKPQDFKVEYDPIEKRIRLMIASNQAEKLKEFKKIDLGADRTAVEQEFTKRLEQLLRLSSPTFFARAEVRTNANALGLQGDLGTGGSEVRQITNLPEELKNKPLAYEPEAWFEIDSVVLEKILGDASWMKTPGILKFLQKPSPQTYETLSPTEKEIFASKAVEIHKAIEAALQERYDQILEGSFIPQTKGLADLILRGDLDKRALSFSLEERVKALEDLAEQIKGSVEEGDIVIGIGESPSWGLLTLGLLQPELKGQIFNLAFSGAKRPKEEDFKFYESYLKQTGLLDSIKKLFESDSDARIILTDVVVSGKSADTFVRKYLVPTIQKATGKKKREIYQRLHFIVLAPFMVLLEDEKPFSLMSWEGRELERKIYAYTDRNTWGHRLTPYYDPTESQGQLPPSKISLMSSIFMFDLIHRLTLEKSSGRAEVRAELPGFLKDRDSALPLHYGRGYTGYEILADTGALDQAEVKRLDDETVAPWKAAQPGFQTVDIRPVLLKADYKNGADGSPKSEYFLLIFDTDTSNPTLLAHGTLQKDPRAEVYSRVIFHRYPAVRNQAIIRRALTLLLLSGGIKTWTSTHAEGPEDLVLYERMTTDNRLRVDKQMDERYERYVIQAAAPAAVTPRSIATGVVGGRAEVRTEGQKPKNYARWLLGEKILVLSDAVMQELSKADKRSWGPLHTRAFYSSVPIALYKPRDFDDFKDWVNYESGMSQEEKQTIREILHYREDFITIKESTFLGEDGPGSIFHERLHSQWNKSLRTDSLKVSVLSDHISRIKDSIDWIKKIIHDVVDPSYGYKPAEALDEERMVNLLERAFYDESGNERSLEEREKYLNDITQENQQVKAILTELVKTAQLDAAGQEEVNHLKQELVRRSEVRSEKSPFDRPNPLNVLRDPQLKAFLRGLLIHKYSQAKEILETNDIPGLVDQILFVAEQATDPVDAGKRLNQTFHFDDPQGRFRKAQKALRKKDSSLENERAYKDQIYRGPVLLDIGTAGGGFLDERKSRNPDEYTRLIGSGLEMEDSWRNRTAPFEFVIQEGQRLPTEKIGKGVVNSANLSNVLHHIYPNFSDPSSAETLAAVRGFLGDIYDTMAEGATLVVTEPSYPEVFDKAFAAAPEIAGSQETEWNERFLQLSPEQRYQYLAWDDWYWAVVYGAMGKEGPAYQMAYRYFTIEKWEEIFKSVGFEVQEAQYWGFRSINLHGASEVFFILKKPSRSETRAVLDKFLNANVRTIGIFGRAGSGKGTLLSYLVEELNKKLPDGKKFVIFPTGDYFRGITRLIRNKAQPGDEEKYRKFIRLVPEQEIKKMESGGLVSDETIIPVVQAVLEEDAYRDAYGIFFDGMPRSPEQLEAIRQGKLLWNGKPLQMDLNVIVDTPEEVLLQRILGRAEADRKRGQERPDAPWTADGQVDVKATQAILMERLKSYNDVTQPLVTALQKETNAIAVQGFARGESNKPLSEPQEVAAVRERFLGMLDTWLDGRSEMRAKKIELVGGEVSLVSLVGFVAAHSAKVAAEIPEEVALANKRDAGENVIITNFKPWTVYESELKGRANSELIADAQSEQKRFARHREAWMAMSEEKRQTTLVEGWKDLDNEEWQGPPRIWLVPENEMAELEPEISETEEGFQFGSNSFAIYSDESKIAYEGNQTDLAEGISGDQFVRMSAASLARIVVDIPDPKTGEKRRHYLLQGVLAGKGKVRYQPFGGRAYFSQKGINEILKREGKFFNRFGIITETKDEPEMAFYIKKSKLDDFLAFYNQERVSGNWDYFVDAAEVLRIELMKELAGVNQDGTPAKNGLPFLEAIHFEKKQEAEEREADEIRKISYAWSRRIQENKIPMDGTIVEVAPGHRTKVGDALVLQGFHGTIIIIEPDEIAAGEVQQAYQRILPQATVKVVVKPVEEIKVGIDIPAGIDALVANHPFDDMVVADVINRGKSREGADWTLTANGLNDIKDQDIRYDENYAQSMLRVVDVWQEFIQKLQPGHFIANQYLSRTLSNQGSHIRQNSGLIVLDLLRDVFGDQLVEQPGKGSVGSFDDPLWWIVARNPYADLTRNLSEKPAAMGRLGKEIFVPQRARVLKPEEFDVAFLDNEFLKNYAGDPLELAKRFAIVLDPNGSLITYADLQKDKTGIALAGGKADEEGNLGSGRAVYVGTKFNILGVGKTSLVRTRDPIHSTGTESLPASLRRSVIAKWINAFTHHAGSHPVVLVLNKTADFFWSKVPVHLALLVRVDDGALDRPSHVEHSPNIHVDFENTLAEYAHLDAEFFSHRMMIGAWSTGNYSLNGHIIDLETVSFVKYRAPYATMSTKYIATRFGYEGGREKIGKGGGFLKVLHQLGEVKGITGIDIDKRFDEERKHQLDRSFLSLLGVDKSMEDQVLAQHGQQVAALADQFETLAKKISPKKTSMSLFDPEVDNESPALLDMSNLFRNLAELYESGDTREKQALDLLIRKTALDQVQPGVVYEPEILKNGQLNEAETFIKEHAVVSHDQLGKFLDQTKTFIGDLFQLLNALHLQNVFPQKSDWQAKLQFMNQDLPIMAELTKKLVDLSEQYRLGKIDGKTLRVETDKLSQLPYDQTGESRGLNKPREFLPSVSELMVRLRSEAPANLAPGRAEVREAAIDSRSREVAQGVARIILSSENLTQEALDTLIRTVRQTVTEISADRFGEIVREEAQAVLQEIEIRQQLDTGNLVVTKEMAENAITWFTNFLVTNKIEGNLAVAFDDPEGGENLLEALEKPGVQSRIGLALFKKGTANGKLREGLKGLNLQFVSSFKSMRPSKAVENSEAVPVVGEDLKRTDYLGINGALFGVGVNKEGSKTGEPFLGVVEKVLQITSGLLLADRIKKVSDLNNPDIKAALLKDLFDNQEKYENVIEFGANGITVNRSRLMNFVTEYLAKKTVEAAA